MRCAKANNARRHRHEYHKVLKRPKFRIAYTELDDFFAFLLDRAEFVISSEGVNIITADPTDNKFLEVALAGKADLIVSGESHLLELKEFRSDLHDKGVRTSHCLPLTFKRQTYL